MRNRFLLGMMALSLIGMRLTSSMIMAARLSYPLQALKKPTWAIVSPSTLR